MPATTLTSPSADQAEAELLDQLVPGPSPLRRLLVLLAVGLLGFGLIVVPSDDFQGSFNDWRHTEELEGQVRALGGGVPGREQAAVVALGDGRVLVWGGRGQSSDSGAVYDPDDGSWTDLPPAPGPGRFSAAAVWTGEEALIWGGSTSSTFDFEPGGVAWNPATQTWRTLPPAPVGLMGARAVALDDGVLITGGSPQQLSSTPPSLWLDLAADTWTPVETPLSVVNTASLGDRLLATGPPALGPGRQRATGWPVAVFDPATPAWTPFADPIVADWTALAVTDAGAVTAVTREALNDPLRAYVWSGSRWDLAAESQLSAKGLVTVEHVMYPPVAAWTGEQLLIGGEGGLTGWDPDRRVLAHRREQAFHTFGGSAVWTGEHLVAPANQSGTGWVLTPS
jgi:hypothetical protein